MQTFSEKVVSLRDAKECGLTEEEYNKICNLLGRNPSYTELGIYSSLWSEHCSYKNSILLLKTYPTESEYTLSAAGEENAGVLDIGDGLALVFKIESHNHPTAIEPYQGAATGVGGIMRDIFTMGARPLCSLNSLRFGPPQEETNRYLFSRAVKGIGDYGNSLGVPVLGGEVFFDSSFSRNCLVNAMVVGVAKHEQLAYAKAEGEGNPVFIVGATTGRDGVHGASFASQDLTKESEDRRSAVQVGNPFLEKLLYEATLEALATDVVVGIQDMGAAGLSCASAEMSAKGKVGMELNLDLVPLREKDMNAFEIMLSESQERMLVVVRAGQEEQVKEIFARWELEAVQIGRVTKDKLLRVFHENRLCADIPADSLVLGGGAPRYHRKQKRPAYLDELCKFNLEDIPSPTPLELRHIFLQLLSSPNLCSRRPVYEQYDSEVGLMRVVGPGSNFGLARIPQTRRGLAVAVDCNSRYVHLNPYIGAASAVFEGARNVATCGAKPIGITNCLNFANPYLPENYYAFAESVRGIGNACRALGIPVTGGNVSFYNESEAGPIYATPTIGTVGLLEDLDLRVASHFSGDAKSIYLIGDFRPVLPGSEYLSYIHKKLAGPPPALDFTLEASLIAFLTQAAHKQLLSSAYDLSLGGLSMALFLSAYNPHAATICGFRLNEKLLQNISVGIETSRLDVLFLGETNTCVIVSVEKEKEDLIIALAHDNGLPCQPIGIISQDQQILDFSTFQIPATLAVENYESGLQGIL